jgi:hypothetical protein
VLPLEVSSYAMKHKLNTTALERHLVSASFIAARWACSRQTVRRVLQRHGKHPLYLGGDVRNATVRFDMRDVLQIERQAQGSPDHVT